MQVNILKIISCDGFNLKKVASTNGGEFKGPCPFCGGYDRFTVWPQKNRYICRQCRKTGDSIQYLRDFKQLTYHEACIELRIQPKIEYKTFNLLKHHLTTKWEPRQVTTPPEQWQLKAERYLFESYKYLLSSAGNQHRQWLHDRGLTVQTIKKARLGWNSWSTHYDRQSWGLCFETDKKGRQKRIWIPQGLIIPYFQNNKIVRLRIRQQNPVFSDRFLMVAGSSTPFMSYAKFDSNKPSMIVEAELDGWLLHQEAGDLVNVFAIGNAQSRPDKEAHEKLSLSPAIILNLDSDGAGRKETLWWLDQYKDIAIDCPCPQGKDSGEAFQAGVNIRLWVQKIIADIKSKPILKSSLDCRSSQETNIKAKDFIDIEYREKSSKTLSKKQTLSVKQSSSKVNQPQNHFQKSSNSLKKTCRHNQFCVHMTHQEIQINDLNIKRPFCMIAKEGIFFLNQCPKKKWELYQLSPVLSQVIVKPMLMR